MFKKIKAVHYGKADSPDDATEIEVSVLAKCTLPACDGSAVAAMIFDNPYGPEGEELQGEFYLCIEHIEMSTWRAQLEKAKKMPPEETREVM